MRTSAEVEEAGATSQAELVELLAGWRPTAFKAMEKVGLLLEDEAESLDRMIRRVQTAASQAWGHPSLRNSLEQLAAQLGSRRAAVREAQQSLWRGHMMVSGPAYVPPLQMTEPARGAKTSRSRSGQVRDRVAELLRTHGPMHRATLLDRLVADGIIGTEAKPINRLASILSENKHLFSTKGGGIYDLLPEVLTEQHQPSPGRSKLSAADQPAAAHPQQTS